MSLNEFDAWMSEYSNLQHLSCFTNTIWKTLSDAVNLFAFANYIYSLWLLIWILRKKTIAVCALSLKNAHARQSAKTRCWWQGLTEIYTVILADETANIKRTNQINIKQQKYIQMQTIFMLVAQDCTHVCVCTRIGLVVVFYTLGWGVCWRARTCVRMSHYICDCAIKSTIS